MTAKNPENAYEALDHVLKTLDIYYDRHSAIKQKLDDDDTRLTVYTVFGHRISIFLVGGEKVHNPTEEETE